MVVEEELNPLKGHCVVLEKKFKLLILIVTILMR